MVDDALEIMTSRTQTGHVFYFKVRASGRVYRMAPERHPRQPRFWCIWIHRCISGGTPDPNERAWLSDEMMTREALPAAMAAAKADLTGWLNASGGAALCAWIQEPVTAVEVSR